MYFDIFFYVIMVFLISYISVQALLSKLRAPTCLPPSPTALPIIGHLHLLNHTPHQTFHKLTTRYGPLIHLRLGSVPCMVASSAHYAKEILKNNDLIFASRPSTITTHLLTYNSSGFAFSSYSLFWKSVKKIVMSQFLDSRNLTRLQPIRSNEVQEFLKLLVNKTTTGESVNLSEEVTKLSNNVVSRMMLGVRCSEEDEQAKEIRSLIRQVTGIMGEFNLSDFIGCLKYFDLQGIAKRAKEIHLRYDGLLERIMREREHVRKKNEMVMIDEDENDRTKDFLDVLMDIMEDEKANITLTREHIKAHMLDFLTAGTDTSGIVIEWALSELLNHPTKLKRAQEEIDSVIGKGRLIEESDFSNLPYLEAIFKETLRLHPPIPVFERNSTHDCKIGGYDIPSDTTLFINVWSIGRDPNTWEHPLEFQPERFIPQNTDDDIANMIDVRGQNFEILPFGSGRRGCPGMSLAVQFVPRVLGLLIQCFEWKVSSHGNQSAGNLIDMVERPGFTLPKAHPLILEASTRFPNLVY